jgi:hypothetical protein
MLKDVIVPKRVHKLVVRYSRMSNGATSPRRSRARRVTQQQQQATGGAAPRRIEEIELTVTREKETGKVQRAILPFTPRNYSIHTAQRSSIHSSASASTR